MPTENQNTDPANAAETTTQKAEAAEFDIVAAALGDLDDDQLQPTEPTTADDGTADPAAVGDPKPSEPAKADEPTLGADGKPAAKETDDERAKREIDEAIDAPVEGVNQRTAARIEKLTGFAKASRAREAEDEKLILDQNNQLAGWGELVQRTGMTPDDFAQTMAVIGWANAGTTDQKREALKHIDVLRTRIASDLGEEAPGVDLLKPYPDLANQVDNDELTRAQAVEIANARTLKARHEQSTAIAQRGEQDRQSVAQAQESAVQVVNQLEVSLRTRDGADVYAVRGGIARDTVMKQVKRGLSPDQWGEAFQDAYDSVPLELVQAGIGKGGQQQIRTPVFRNGAGAGADVQADPKDDYEVVARSLAG